MKRMLSSFSLQKKEMFLADMKAGRPRPSPRLGNETHSRATPYCVASRAR